MANGNGGNGGNGPTAAQVNRAARDLVLERSIDMTQVIFSTTLLGVPAGQNIIVPIRNVGLIKKFIVKVTFTVTPLAAETHTLTPYGLANVFSEITMNDMANQQRIVSTGMHLHLLACVRRQSIFGAAFTTDSPAAGTIVAPYGLGSNFATVYSPAVVAGAAADCTMYYEIPVAYSDFDLRGAIYASVVSSTMVLNFRVNPNFEVTAAATDVTDAVYQSSNANLATISNFRVVVYQNYLDQLPRGDKGVVLPPSDISTAYLLNNVAYGELVVNQDRPFPYANFRSFMSTIAVFNNGGTLGVGADVDSWSLRSANFTNIWQLDPNTVALLTKEIMNDDMPIGGYYFDHRRRPINTTQFGNMELVLRPTVVNANANVRVFYEALSIINLVTQAGSLRV